VKDGGPAFPVAYREEGANWDTAYLGMSLRDYFAATILQGLCANTSVLNNDHEIKDEQLPVAAYYLADIMLKARVK